MSDQLGEDVPSETAQSWDSVRRVREPVAWALLVVAAIALLVSAWQLFGLPGDGLPAGPVAASARSQSGRGYRSQSGRGDVLRVAGIGCGAAICRRWHLHAASPVGDPRSVRGRSDRPCSPGGTDRDIGSGSRAGPWRAQLAGRPGRPLAAWRLVHLRRNGSRCHGGRADIHRRGAPVAAAAATR